MACGSSICGTAGSWTASVIGAALEAIARGLRRSDYRRMRRSRSALVMTDSELMVIAALAQIGLISTPTNGYNTPAATGTPIVLYTNARKGSA